MKIKITLILSLFLLLCSCAENAGQSAGSNHTYLPDPSMPDTPVTGQLPEPDADVPGTGEPEALDPVLPAEETDGETYCGTDPWLNDPDNPESEKWRHSFMTTAFFENGYNIRLAWNNPPSLYETTRQIIADQAYTVSFIEETKGYADDPQVLEAIRLCILSQKQEEIDADDGPPEEVFLLTNPVVVDVDGPYEDSDQ